MRACSILRQPPLHQKRNNDQDDNQGRENVSASTLVSIDTAPGRRFTTWSRPHLRTGIGRMITMLHAALAAEPRCLQHPSKAPRAPRVPALNLNEERPENCYCSAFPRGSGPRLPCYVRRLRLAETSRHRSRPAKLGERRRLGSDGPPSPLRPPDRGLC